MKILFITLAALISTAASAQHNAAPAEMTVKETSFGNGEKLTFTIGYSLAKVLNGDIGEVSLRVNNTIVNDIPTYRIHANAKTLPGYKLFYDLDDTYQTWLDVTSLQPVQSSSRLKEGKYRYMTDFVFDWDEQVVHSTYRNLKRPDPKHKTMPLHPGSADALGIFYNLRSEDAATFIPGVEREMRLVLEDTIRRVSYKFLGREVKNFKRLGTFNTLKFSCKLASSSGESFEDGSEFFLWISDDKNKIPLYIESPIKVGSIKGTLVKYEGLKYPLESKIK